MNLAGLLHVLVTFQISHIGLHILANIYNLSCIDIAAEPMHELKRNVIYEVIQRTSNYHAQSICKGNLENY
jgi:hypothetical protein